MAGRRLDLGGWEHEMFRMLVPTDGSEPARRAVDYAADLVVHRAPAEVHTVYVASVPASVAQREFETQLSLPLSMLLPDEREEATTIAEMAALRIRALTKNSAITVTPIVLVHESPAKALLAFADANEIDIIVMGSRGLGSISSIFLGSVSQKVLRGAWCPVLIVK